MMASVPSVAPVTPPETGASTKRSPRSAAAAATRRETAGSMVDMSTQSVPLRRRRSTPPSPVNAASTCEEEGSIVMTRSAPATASAAEAAAVMPAAAAALHRLRVQVEGGHREALLDEIDGHGQPHGADADEADAGHAAPPDPARSRIPVRSSMSCAIAV